MKTRHNKDDLRFHQTHIPPELLHAVAFIIKAEVWKERLSPCCKPSLFSWHLEGCTCRRMDSAEKILVPKSLYWCFPSADLHINSGKCIMVAAQTETQWCWVRSFLRLSPVQRWSTTIMGQIIEVMWNRVNSAEDLVVLQSTQGIS